MGDTSEDTDGTSVHYRGSFYSRLVDIKDTLEMGGHKASSILFSPFIFQLVRISA
jgi:hypothetical protein